MIQSRDEQRQHLRAQLTKELLGNLEAKKKDKLPNDIRKKCGKTKFLQNPNNRKPKDEKPNYMDKCPDPNKRSSRVSRGITAAKVIGERK